ncbi:MAG: DnaB-like helicase N-terminal domain-containing protein [Campylobacterota bacterium]|nr:DnaB-like helicase N-terminal domain-containing protein [Campylobacterota bacterium]
MKRDLLLDVQRKVLGGYINAEEFGDSIILDIRLDESLFDLIIHKAVVRACNHLADKGIPVSDFTVLDFLQSHKMPNGTSQEAEYAHLMTEWAIAPKTFNTYIEMIYKHKMEN